MIRLTTLIGILLLTGYIVVAQKKPLDHSVYDQWQSIGERAISNNGKYIAYIINVQEGDAKLIVQENNGKKLIEIPRGYNISFTEDNQYLICKIKPTYQQTREAKIKKKKSEEMPKDSLGIIQLSTLSFQKIPSIKSYKLPENNSNYLAYLKEKTIPAQETKPTPDSLQRINSLNRLADSLVNVADSIRKQLSLAKEKGLSVLNAGKSNKKDEKPAGKVEEGTELVLYNLTDNRKDSFALTSDYYFDKKGNVLLLETTRKNNDTLSKANIVWLQLNTGRKDTVMSGFNDARNFAFDSTGSQLAFIAERDSSEKAVNKFYKLWHYKPGFDSSRLLVTKNTNGMPDGWSVSENGNVWFSPSGKRLLFRTSPVLPPKDTTLPEFERVKVDIWNYKDEQLQTVQLANLNANLKKSYTALYNPENNNILQLSNEYLQLLTPGEGDGTIYYAASDSGNRAAMQWQGFILKQLYAVNPANGNKTLIQENFHGDYFPSVTGKYLLLYNQEERNYSIYNATTGKTTKIEIDAKYPLYDEDNDMPTDPEAYGIAGWEENDRYVYIYDRYDLWKVNPEMNEKPVAVTNGRPAKNQFRYVRTNKEDKFFQPGNMYLLSLYNETDKSSGLALFSFKQKEKPVILFREAVKVSGTSATLIKAKEANSILYTKETFQRSPDLYFRNTSTSKEIKLSAINPQQADYLWGTAELYKWKAYTGKITEGILYKPENFDPKKKYPMILYFYERYNETLNNYQAPAPTPSRLNITFFVSRGYVVFVPDVWYTTGHPGKSAYDYIVSGTRALIKEGFIDSTRIGLQGQSWGGYQTAWLIAQTNLYAAAWAGAPVSNMFSAYGGIRWESGLTRQFQYEKSQSRIGATIWERPDLYTENSPLFHLPNVKTPLVIMSNDADGAVPWYQGIELFTALRRLDKPVWLLNYNGEAHNLMERKNRKDIQIREQQFFDWILKGDTAPKWLNEGVPAILNGRINSLE